VENTGIMGDYLGVTKKMDAHKMNGSQFF